MNEWICPRCKHKTTDFPAISRRDNKTSICSGCGQKEAFLDYALTSKTPKEKLLFLSKDAMWLPPNEYNLFLKKLQV